MGTPAGPEIAWGSGSWVETTEGEGAKTVRITDCPNDTAPVHSECTVSGSEAATLEYYTNLDSSDYCVLQPDTTYYFQVINKLDPDSSTYACGGSPEVETSECGFYFSAN
jgi:hypothetical protein